MSRTDSCQGLGGWMFCLLDCLLDGLLACLACAFVSERFGFCLSLLVPLCSLPNFLDFILFGKIQLVEHQQFRPVCLLSGSELTFTRQKLVVSKQDLSMFA